MPKSFNPSENVTGKNSSCIQILNGTFPLGLGIFGEEVQNRREKIGPATPDENSDQ